MDETFFSKMVLRNLPLPPRLVLSAFLISVGVGYLSALVQLHFQHASPGQLMPGAEEAAKVYHGATNRPQSTLERLLEAPDAAPFNGTGSMRPAFTTKSDKWKRAIKDKNDEQMKSLLQEREGERLALLEWVRAGASKEAYDKDAFALSAGLASQPITEEFLAKDADGKPASPRQVTIKTLLEKRCVDCHADGGRFIEAAKFPLDSFDRVKPYVQVKAAGGGMSLTKLAQTTHVHLLGFSMLYGLTGLIFAFTSYPLWFRCLVGPLPLLAQLADISCWWLARYDARFAQVILVTGGLVALGLAAHIVLSLFNMYDRRGKKVVALLLVLAAVGGLTLKAKVVDPFLEQERTSAAATGE
jgi:hypothetical protein